MKAFLIWYWFFGCLIAGVAIAGHHDKCPKDSVAESYDALATVVIWPVILVGALSASKPFTTECKRS